jgi:RNA ligase
LSADRIHPAHLVPFDTLITALNQEVIAGNVSTSQHGPLTMYRYTQQCVFEKQWNQWSLMARGLITDGNRIVATPFPKFFNYAEHDVALPEEPFEVTEKMDGSLGIIFYYSGRWHVATRGSFTSEQAQWAEAWLYKNVKTDLLLKGTTYLVEIIYNANRIVVTYDFEGLVLLAAYTRFGTEYPSHHLQLESHAGFILVKSHWYETLDFLLEIAKRLEKDREGFVVRFQSGLRIKIKGDEYCRVHRLVSHVTPLAVWDMMAAGDDLTLVARELPEEFRRDFEEIQRLLTVEFQKLLDNITVATHATSHMNDKDLGLWLKYTDLDSEVYKWVFPARKKNLLTVVHEPCKMRRQLFDTFRPTGNKLAGYVPSSLLNRFNEEASSI